MGSQCTSPSRAQGGLGFHEQHYAHLSLLGTTYLVLRNPHSGNNPFDNYMLPRDLLLETAAQDLGADYAARLLSARVPAGAPPTGQQAAPSGRGACLAQGHPPGGQQQPQWRHGAGAREQ